VVTGACVQACFAAGVVEAVAPSAAKVFPILGVVGDNAAIIPGAMYMLFYIYLGFADGKPLLGLLAASMIGGLVYAANLFASSFTIPADLPFATVWNIALIVHIVGWAIQVYGHSKSILSSAVVRPRNPHLYRCS